MKQGTARGILLAILVMICMTLLTEKYFDIDNMPAHLIAGMSITIWIISCVSGLALYFSINHKTRTN